MPLTIMMIKRDSSRRKLLAEVVGFILTVPVFSCSCVSPVDAESTLKLEEVLGSVDRHHPLLRSALQERSIAAAQLLEAQGAFDPKLRSSSGSYLEGDYSGTYYDLSVEQPTPYNGISVYAGQRRSGGTFPIHSNQLETNDDGETRVGISMPLLRNREIDEPRTRIKQAEVLQNQADASVQLEYLDLIRQATHAYWEWVAAGQQLVVYEHLVKVAELRQRQLGIKVQSGDLAEIYLTDNNRALLKRRSQVLKSLQKLQKGELKLSLFLRTDDGSVLVPSRKRLPASFPIPLKEEIHAQEQFAESALQRRPEVQLLAAEQQKIEMELSLAENKMLPKVDLDLAAADDHGPGSTSRNEAELKGLVKIEVPLRLRQQRGKIEAQKSKLRALAQKNEYLSQKINTEVQTALANLKIAFDIITVQQAEVEAAEILEEGERVKFEQGDSNLIFVNIREQTTADASAALIDAFLDFRKALADFRASAAQANFGLDASR
jgi:outer membrane protein, heavy metal efflux system